MGYKCWDCESFIYCLFILMTFIGHFLYAKEALCKAWGMKK